MPNWGRGQLTQLFCCGSNLVGVGNSSEGLSSYIVYLHMHLCLLCKFDFCFTFLASAVSGMCLFSNWSLNNLILSNEGNFGSSGKFVLVVQLQVKQQSTIKVQNFATLMLLLILHTKFSDFSDQSNYCLKKVQLINKNLLKNAKINTH